jgi:transcription elongation factor Elf1
MIAAKRGERGGPAEPVLAAPRPFPLSSAPDGRRGKVTCPTCGAEWFHPDTIELSDVEFRCSMSGARFNVISSRRSPLHKLVIQKINKATSGASRPAEPHPLSSSQLPSLNAGAPPVPLIAPTVGGWLARIVGRKSELVPSTPSAAVPTDQTTRATVSGATHNADEYNWTGFSCPYCNASSFVSCSGGHLSCDGTAEVRNGRRFHQCFCGNAAFISDTPMKTLESKRLSVDREEVSPKPPMPDPQQQNSKSADVTLLPPTRGTPAKR